MMAYIQVLAIVLCSCFIQDAISMANVRKPTSSAAPANDAAASSLAGAAISAPKVRRVTSSTTATDAAATKLTDGAAVGQPAATVPKVRRTTTVKRTVSSRKPTAVQAPPPKYPYLTAVKNLFWKTFEDINRESTNGKRNMRLLRNTMRDVLGNDLFWSSVAGGVRRRVKVTNDAQRADSKIRMCDAITTAMTCPNATKNFQDVANEVYGTVSRIRSDMSTDALELANIMVQGGEVTRGLEAITNIVENVRLNPRLLISGFAMFRRTLNLGGSINMGGGLAKGLMSITSKLNN